MTPRVFAKYLRKTSQRNSAKTRRVSPQVVAEFRGLRNLAEKKMVCANLCEISRSFLRESSRLRIFVSGVNAIFFFSGADLYKLSK